MKSATHGGSDVRLLHAWIVIRESLRHDDDFLVEENNPFAGTVLKSPMLLEC